MMTKENRPSQEYVGKWSPLFLGLGLLLTLLLVYATFVPLNYQPLTWGESRERWKFIPWLNLGLYSRADWIANCLVVMPASFFLAGGLDLGLRSRLSWFLIYPIVAFWLACIVVGMEFAQVWFPPRTVSQNDIAAGLMGILGGAWAWLLFGRSLLTIVLDGFHTTCSRDRLSLIAFLTGCGCFIYAVLPLDVMLNKSEWGQKVSMGRLAIFPFLKEFSTLTFYKGLMVALLQSVPWGIFFGLLQSKGGARWKWVIGFSLLLEFVQVPIFTKHTTSLDFVLSVVGGLLGYRIIGWLLKFKIGINRSATGSIALLGGLVWAICLIMANTLRFDHVEKDMNVLGQRAVDFFQYPFLRYYYTSEFSALSSILGKLLGFGLLGGLFGYAVWARGVGRSVGFARVLVVGLICLMVSGLIEAIQIFLPPLLPDINDLILAGVGGICGAGLVGFLTAVPWDCPGVGSSAEIRENQAIGFDFAGLRREFFSFQTIFSVAAWTVFSILIALLVSQLWLPAWGLLDELAGWVPARIRHGGDYVSPASYYSLAHADANQDSDQSEGQSSASVGRKKLLQESDFEYLGSFRIPACYPNQTTVSNASGGMALRYQDGQLHFILTGHYARGGLMYECRFPGLGKRLPYPKAQIVREHGDVYQSQKWLQPVPGKVITELSADVSTNGLYYDDPNETLYWAYGHYFNVDNPFDNSFGVSRWNTEKGRFQAIGSWGVEKIPEKYRRGGFIELPEWFRTRVLKGDYLGIGQGGYYSIVASASFGPALSVFDKKSLGKFRSHSDIPGQLLLGYPHNIPVRCWRTADYRSEFDGGKWNPEGDRGYWAWTDGVSSAVWLDLPTHHGLFFFARLGTGRVWYEDSTLNAQGTKLVWIQYDPNDLVDVAEGKKRPWESQPVAMWDAPVQSQEPIAKWERQHGYKGTSLAFISGAAFDRRTQTLFLLSNAGYRTGLFEWAPQIYAFKVAPKS